MKHAIIAHGSDVTFRLDGPRSWDYDGKMIDVYTVFIDCPHPNQRPLDRLQRRWLIEQERDKAISVLSQVKYEHGEWPPKRDYVVFVKYVSSDSLAMALFDMINIYKLRPRTEAERDVLARQLTGFVKTHLGEILDGLT